MFTVFESSAQLGKPVHLVLFEQGSLVWRFTTAKRAVVAMGETWEPPTDGEGKSRPLKIGRFVQTGNLLKNKMTMTFPIGNEFARRYLGSIPQQSTAVTIFTGHIGDPDEQWISPWSGRVSDLSTKAKVIELGCDPYSVAMKQNGMWRKAQKNCGHSLYSDVGCRLTMADWAVRGYVESVSGLVLVVPAAAAYPDGRFQAGILKTVADGLLASIASHVGDTLTLVQPIYGLADAVANAGYGNSYGNHYGGVGVDLHPGCDRSKKVCNDIFNNLDNHGGGYYPSRSPFDGSSIA